MTPCLMVLLGCANLVAFPGPEPDYAMLLPVVLEAAERTMYEGALESPIAIHMGSFISEMNRTLPHSIRADDLVRSLDTQGRRFTPRQAALTCSDEKVCRWNIDEPFWVELVELTIPENGGVIVEVRLQSRSTSSIGFVTNVVAYEFAWQGEQWVLVNERVKLRS